MQRKPTTARRVRVEAGIYRSPASGKLEIQYTDRNGRTRWRTVDGDVDQARRARAEAQVGLGDRRGRLRSRSTFGDVANEWLGLQTHLRPRTHELYANA